MQMNNEGQQISYLYTCISCNLLVNYFNEYVGLVNYTFYVIQS